jgi:hypothetical protein
LWRMSIVSSIRGKVTASSIANSFSEVAPFVWTECSVP